MAHTVPPSPDPVHLAWAIALSFVALLVSLFESFSNF